MTRHGQLDDDAPVRRDLARSFRVREVDSVILVLMTDVNSSQFWQNLYRQGRTGWDLGRETPVFGRLLERGRLSPGRVIVLGAGRGHDARLFARHGFQVTAVDFAPAAIRAMEDRNDPDAPVSVIHDDIFGLPADFNGTFDYVLEYTLYCAIEPARRNEYADVVGGLLKPGGHYVGLAFPVGEQPGGPPFAVSVEELVTLLEAQGLRLQHRESPHDSVPGRRGREELLILQKDPTSNQTDGQEKL